MFENLQGKAEGPGPDHPAGPPIFEIVIRGSKWIKQEKVVGIVGD
jgi:hypothetical protein